MQLIPSLNQMSLYAVAQPSACKAQQCALKCMMRVHPHMLSRPLQALASKAALP